MLRVIIVPLDLSKPTLLLALRATNVRPTQRSRRSANLDIISLPPSKILVLTALQVRTVMETTQQLLKTAQKVSIVFKIPNTLSSTLAQWELITRTLEE